jgi:hypothetical protein
MAGSEMGSAPRKHFCKKALTAEDTEDAEEKQK